MQKPLAVFLMGPTASGKTDLAISLSRHLPIEIISVDSALIYKGMDIGTAKPSQIERNLVPHHLIDLIDPAESYSVANFCQDALQKMSTIVAQGKTPVLVGGTMLYYKGLLEGLSPLPSADPSMRAEIERKAQLMGWNKLHQYLMAVDPISAKRINPNDSQRIGRALEVFYLSGKTMTELIAQRGEGIPYDIVQFAIMPEARAILHQRIEQRFYQMMAQGFENEVVALFKRGDLHENLPSIRCVGYRQIWSYLKGEYSLEEAIFRGICATRQLAKRQITWLRGWTSELEWLDSLSPEVSRVKIIEKIEQKIKNLC